MACPHHGRTGAPRTTRRLHPLAEQAAQQRAAEELRSEVGGRLEELRANLERGLVAGVEGQPAAPAVLQSCASRVEELGGAVAQLCAHMETMRVKEVAALAEERIGEVEARLVASQQEQLAALQQQAQATQHHMVVRLAALEAAVQQEQQSSLKALQAILHSANGQ